MIDKTTEERLNILFNNAQDTYAPHRERIEKIMARIEQEPVPVPMASQAFVPTSLRIKPMRLWSLKKGLVAAALLTAFLFVPINGNSFGGSVIEWMKETVIHSGQNHLVVSDEVIPTVSEDPPYELNTFATLETALEDMAKQGVPVFGMPTMPSGYVFNESTKITWTDGPYTTRAYDFFYSTSADGIKNSPDAPQLILEVRIFDTLKTEEKAPAAPYFKIAGDGLKSVAIPFKDQEAVLVNNHERYSIVLPGLIQTTAEDGSRELILSVSYKNHNGTPVWEEAKSLLEKVYEQYAK